MEKNNKKRVFTGTVAMLVILFGLLRIAIFTGYHMVTPFLPEIARNLDTTIVVIGLAISIRSVMGCVGPVWGGIIDLFGKKNSLLLALLTFAASYAAIYFFPSFPCFVVALPISYAATLTFDSAMYSYLSEMIPYEGRGRMTAVLEAAYALGFMIGSPVAGVLMENFGWAVPFVLMAGIAVVFAIALGFILPKEGEKRFGIDATVSHEMQENKAEKGSYFHRLSLVLKDKNALAALLTGSLLMGGNWFCQTMYGGWLEDNFDQGLSEIGFISAAFGLAVFVGSLLCLTLTDKLGKTKAMKLGAIVTICGGVIAAFTNQKSLIIGSIGLFLYFAFVEFATEACISLCTDVRAEIRGTVIGSSFGALAIGSTIGTGVSPVLYTKFGYTPCIIVGTVIVAIALLVIAKVLTPGFANKEKN